MAQQGAPEHPPAPDAPPATLPAGDLPLSAERRAVLEPKLRSLLREFEQLEALEGPDVEPCSVLPVAREAEDAR